MKKILAISTFSLALLLNMLSASAFVEADPNTTSGEPVTISGFQRADGTVELSWTAYLGTDFSGYKVVHSTTVTEPVYPDNGYLTYITDVNTLSYQHTGVKEGKNYYRICTLTSSSTLCGNTLTIESDASLEENMEIIADEYSDDPAIEIVLNAIKNGDNTEANLSWTKYEAGDLKWYKVVRSATNDMPYYPNDGYIGVLSYANETSYVDKSPLGGTNNYRVCVITTANKRGCSNVVTLNFQLVGEMPFTNYFPDMKDHWAREYANVLASKGIVKGIDGQFMPDRNVLRSEALKMIMYAYEHEGDNCDASLFTDMKSGDWFCAVATKAKIMGIIAGSDGKLLPTRNITRAEAVKILIETRGDKMAMVSVNPFTDVDKDAWYAKYVYHAKRLGLVSGIDGKFFPEKYITRAELAKIISISLDKEISE